MKPKVDPEAGLRKPPPIILDLPPVGDWRDDWRDPPAGRGEDGA